MDFSNLSVQQLIVIGLMSAVASLIMGKTLKRVIYWVVKWVVEKTSWKKDNELLPDIREDFGLDEEKK